MPNESAFLIPLDVFISFSRQDVSAADRVCHALEAFGIQCWMAHRDIAPGRGYLGPVLEAADRCRAVLLLFSSHTTAANTYVLDRAAKRGVPIIWLMIDNATPPPEFERFRESALVIDASVPPLESHFRSLAARIQTLSAPFERSFAASRSFSRADGRRSQEADRHRRSCGSRRGEWQSEV